jgi:hypothetical protein
MSGSELRRGSVGQGHHLRIVESVELLFKLVVESRNAILEYRYILSTRFRANTFRSLGDSVTDLAKHIHHFLLLQPLGSNLQSDGTVSPVLRDI